MDGAGKSTQIRNLQAQMEAAGRRVAVVTFWDDVARLKGLRESSGHTLFKGDKGIGSPERPINRRDKNVRGWPMTLVRYFLYLVDSISLRRTVRRSLRSEADFLIFDRYSYDELANLSLSNPVTRLYVRLIQSFVPRPHVSYVLDAEPAAARARKPEYPVDFLILSRQSYLTLARLLGYLTVIPPGPVEQVSAQVLAAVAPRVPAPETARP
jgi:thymidylate kinase